MLLARQNERAKGDIIPKIILTRKKRSRTRRVRELHSWAQAHVRSILILYAYACVGGTGMRALKSEFAGTPQAHCLPAALACPYNRVHETMATWVIQTHSQRSRGAHTASMSALHINCTATGRDGVYNLVRHGVLLNGRYGARKLVKPNEHVSPAQQIIREEIWQGRTASMSALYAKCAATGRESA